MGSMFTTTINEVDRKTNKELANGKSVETAGPLAMLPDDNIFDNGSFDEFSSSNPFAQSSVDYSAYTSSPVTNNGGETSYAIAMAGMLSFGGSDFSGGDVGGFSSDGGFTGGDCGGAMSAGGGDCGGSCGGGGGFSASC